MTNPPPPSPHSHTRTHTHPVFMTTVRYGQFSRVACTSPLFLDEGPRVIALTASGEDGQTFRDVSLFSVELESDDLRKEM